MHRPAHPGAYGKRVVSICGLISLLNSKRQLKGKRCHGQCLVGAFFYTDASIPTSFEPIVPIQERSHRQETQCR